MLTRKKMLYILLISKNYFFLLKLKLIYFKASSYKSLAISGISQCKFLPVSNEIYN